MKIFFVCFFMMTLFTKVHAQEEEVYRNPSKESLAYHDYRTTESSPPYGLLKIKKLIGQLKLKEDNEGGGLLALNYKTYALLSLREKFTYHLIHGEAYSQICDAYPPTQDEHKKIFGYLPDVLDEYNWSEGQLKFLRENRDSVMALIKECVTKKNHVGVNFKRAIVEINGIEMIPFLIKIYNSEKKDGDLLTLLNLLLRRNKDAAFLASATYKKLYGEEYSFTSFILFNKANEALIIKRATDFYNAKSN